MLRMVSPNQRRMRRVESSEVLPWSRRVRTPGASNRVFTLYNSHFGRAHNRVSKCCIIHKLETTWKGVRTNMLEAAGT